MLWRFQWTGDCNVDNVFKQEAVFLFHMSLAINSAIYGYFLIVGANVSLRTPTLVRAEECSGPGPHRVDSSSA